VSPRTARRVFVLVGALHAAFGLYMLLAPGSFYETIGTFEPRNDHYIRDLATFYVALGVAFALAGPRPAWRAPVLLLAIVQYALHTANHLYDLGRPEEDWVGPVTAALVAAALVLLAGLAYVAARRGRAP
jgi:Domain of unknown function (DUF4345)